MVTPSSSVSEASLPPPPEFTHLVRDALRHLYDPAYLLGHPLATRLASQLPEVGNPAQSLRVCLLDALECLEPSGEASSEKEQRPYKVLVHRYVGGLSVDEIADRLHVGPRQVRREHERGVEALAAYLWRLGSPSSPAASSSPAPPPSGLQEELESLGLVLESVSLHDVLATIEDAAQALIHGYSMAFQVTMSSADMPVLVDRTLAKQAVLSCLRVLASRQPRYVEVSVVAQRMTPALRIQVRPTLETNSVQLLEDLHACRTLLAAQGGRVRLLSPSDGLCAGVDLLFRPQSRAHVLVVDDNEKMLQLYTRYLARGQYQVSTATSAQEAMALLDRVIPDAIILDVMMRDVDGWELLQSLRAAPHLRDVQVIVCSVLDEPDLALFLGAQAYLKKPLVPEDLLTTLQRLLDESSQGERSRAEP